MSQRLPTTTEEWLAAFGRCGKINCCDLRDTACPKCGSRGVFIVELSDRGEDYCNDHFWDSDSLTICYACGHRTAYRAFVFKGLDIALERETEQP